jgi:RNA polymerase sigma-70 factor (ECF subfamily)
LAVPDDAELMRRVAHGHHDAFAALVHRHARYLFGVALGLCGNSADAEDLVQETFTAALTSHFRGESAVRTWMVKILVNRAALLRRRATFSRRGLAAGRPEAGPAKPQAADAVDAGFDLATMLAALSPEHREVIVLRELEHMTYDEIAAALQVPRGTVESRLHRAREDLRTKFSGYQP